MQAIHVPHPLHTRAPAPAADETVQLQQLLQQDLEALDLSAHGLLLSEDVNCVMLKNYLLRRATVESVNIRGAQLSTQGWECLIDAVDAGGAAQLRYLGLKQTNISSELFIQLMNALVQHAPMLSCLDMSETDLGDEVLSELLLFLSASTQHLDVSKTHFTEKAMAKICNKLGAEGTSALLLLNVSFNRLDYAAASALGTLVSQSPQLRELYLSHCRIDDASAECIAAGVHQSILESLDLSYNDAAPAFASVRTNAAVALPSTLRRLSLSHNPVHSTLVQGLAANVNRCAPGLQELRLAGTMDSDSSMLLMLTELRQLPQLKVLDMEQCRLTFRGAKSLGQRLLLYPLLEELNLSDNMLSMEGIAELSFAIEHLDRLKELRLASCQLGNCGAVSVVNLLLRSVAPLSVLDLSDNHITDAGMRDVCALLSRLTSPKLDRLILSKNDCTMGSKMDLTEMMNDRQNSCLVEAHETPLEEVANTSASREGSANSSRNSSVL